MNKVYTPKIERFIIISKVFVGNCIKKTLGSTGALIPYIAIVFYILRVPTIRLKTTQKIALHKLGIPTLRIELIHRSYNINMLYH